MALYTRLSSLERRINRLTLLFILIMCALFSPQVNEVSATTLQPLSLSELIKMSAWVVRGTVIGQVVYETSDGVIWTRYSLHITERWKGNPQTLGKTLSLDLRGGQIGEGITFRKQVIHGQPSFHVGDEGIYFLERTSTGRLVMTGMAQGWFKLIREGDQTWAVRHQEYRAHLSQKTPVLRFTGVSHPDRLPLSELRRLVTLGADRPKALVVIPTDTFRQVEPGNIVEVRQ